MDFLETPDARFNGLPDYPFAANRTQVDADGLLSVAAREMGSGVEASVQVKPSYGLADDDIARMLREGFASADADMVARRGRGRRAEAAPDRQAGVDLD